MRRPFLLLALGALACGSPAGRGGVEPLRGEPVPVLPLPEEAQAHFRFHGGWCAPARQVVRTAEEWEASWAELTAGYEPVPAAPAVDFGEEMLLVAAMGERTSGGYTIEVEAAALDGGTLRARLVETSPGPTCATTQAITCPAAAVRVPRHVGAVAFETDEVVLDCGP
jgi:hypothetical protein